MCENNKSGDVSLTSEGRRHLTNEDREFNQALIFDILHKSSHTCVQFYIELVEIDYSM